MSTGYQHVIDVILGGGTDQQIIEAALQQTRYDSGHALQMMAAARGSGTIATVVSLNPVASVDSPDGSPQNVVVTGTTIPATTGTQFTLMQGATQIQQAGVLPGPGGVLTWIFTAVPIGANYQVVVTVPAEPTFTPVLSNFFAVIDASAMLLPEHLAHSTAQAEGARVV